MAGMASLLPSGLYSAGQTGLAQSGSLLDRFLSREQAPSAPVAQPSASGIAQRVMQGSSGSGSVMLAAPAEKPKIEMYSAEFYRACTIGGILSCALVSCMQLIMGLACCSSDSEWHSS